MSEPEIRVTKTHYGFKVPLPTGEFRTEYGAYRFDWDPHGQMTLMSVTKGIVANSANVSPYTKKGYAWFAGNTCAGLPIYGPDSLEYKAFEALLEASSRQG